MDSNKIEAVATVFKDSIESTQENATNVDGLVNGILDLTDQKTHNAIIDTIQSADTLSSEEKIARLSQERIAFKQDQTVSANLLADLQNVQTENVVKSTSPTTTVINYFLAILVGAAIGCSVSPEGRKLIKSSLPILLQAFNYDILTDKP